VDQGDGGSLGGCNGPAFAEKVDLVVGVDPPFQMESQMEVQQGCGWTGACGGAFFVQGFLPGSIWAEVGGAAEGGVLALNLPVEHGLGGGIMSDLFIGQDCHQPFLQGAEAAFDFAFGLGAGGDQMGDPEGGEGALELRAGIAVIGHGIMAEEAEAVGVYHHRQAVPEKEVAEMLEVIPSGVGGDEDRTQEFAGMVVHGEQQGLLVLGGPPLVDGRIVLPQLVQARAFPAPPSFGAWFGLAEELWKVGSGISGDGLPVAFEAQACFQFIGHQLEIGRFLKREELPEEGHGLWRPVWPMVAAGELGGEFGAVL